MIIHTGSKVEETQQQKNIASTIRQRASRIYVTIPNVDRVLFLPERGVAQLPLPFPGWRRIGKGIWKRFYAAARYPGWDLSHDGKPLTFAFDPLQQAEVEEYMDDNCREGDYVLLGSTVMHLEQEYDPRQLWLGFIDALIKRPALQTAANRHNITSSMMRRRKLIQQIKADEPLIRIETSDQSRHIYRYDKDIHQIVLPFVEFKSVSDIEWKMLAAAEYPSWERIEGYLANINAGGFNYAETLEWLMDNCRGRFRYKSRSIRFELINDYAMAKLRFT
ncbi:unnamed protein product [Sphagnum tenellum]